jgi:hypothetical protein
MDERPERTLGTGTAHLVPLEAPEAANTLILDFVAELRRNK